MRIMTNVGPSRIIHYRRKASAILILGLMSMPGCDLPDRHDIAALRRPAVWEITPDSSAIIREETQLSHVSVLAEKENFDSQTWEFWYLHRLNSVIGGFSIRSENLAVTGMEVTAQVKVTLNERIVRPLRPAKPKAFPTENDPQEDSEASQPSGESKRQSNDAAFCLTANEQTFWHSSDGQLQKAVCSVRRGPIETSKTISVDGGSILIETNGPAGLTRKQLPLKGPLGGPLMVHQSLLRNPMGGNEVRQATVLLPTHDAVAKLRLRSNPPVMAKRLTQDKITLETLNEAIGLISVGESQHRERYYWYDDEGIVQTTNIVGDPSFSFRCSESQFTASSELFSGQSNPIGVKFGGESIPKDNSFDRISHLAIDVQRINLNASLELVDRLRLQPAPQQYVQTLDDQRDRIIIAKEPVPASKLKDRFSVYESPSQPMDLAPSVLVDFRAGKMQGVLGTVRSLRGLEKKELSEEINRTVHSLLTYRSLAKGFQPASQIASSTSADSTEHSILLMAMLRANGIPARMVLGLRLIRQSENSNAFAAESVSNSLGYHAWVIAEVEGRWIALDPTTGRPTTIDCIALETTDLSEPNVELHVDRILGQLRMFDFNVHKVVLSR